MPSDLAHAHDFGNQWPPVGDVVSSHQLDLFRKTMLDYYTYLFSSLSLSLSLSHFVSVCFFLSLLSSLLFSLLFSYVGFHCYSACTLTCELVLESMAMALGIQHDFFVDHHSKSDHVLELKNYPPVAIGSPVRLRPHSDQSSVTLLTQDALGGLEVLRSGSADWIAAPSLEDTVLVNTGNFMKSWSGGTFPSTIHRVAAPGGSYKLNRISAVFFYTPNWDAEVACAKAGINGFSEEPFLVGDVMPF
eukprot:gnl/Hemi2/6377_TR2188_c0_g5_i1.p1 gnl/Hemi2/6377_TR2188_c0_g5~~gnl/Hemi2/6377_TR2188_c0_g5_i1.p1  ORF type:complete len:246 (+),score=8.45 gnl/Hemi2/6377_TR2188_c0_g5_i1:445-1182(+)